MRHIIIYGIAITFCLLAIYSCEKADVNADITLNIWEIKSIKKHGTFFSEKAKNNYNLEFTSDTTFSLNLDVNICWGTYEIFQNGKIEFKNIACTYVGGDSEFAELLRSQISKLTDYSVKGDILTLKGDGEIKMKRI
jgi:hypothetical protein